MGRNKFFYGIDENYVDHDEPANDSVQNMEGILKNVIFSLLNETEKSLSEIHYQIKKIIVEVNIAISENSSLFLSDM